MEETREIKLESWDRFVTRNLTVEYALMGKSHVFPYANAEVSITLPKPESLAENHEKDSSAYLYSWRMEGDKRVILEVSIHSVDVCVRTSDVITLPEGVFNRRPKAIDLIPEVDQNRLEEISKYANDLASNAFEYWLSILRWKCDNHRIGRPTVSDNKSGWSTYLRDTESLHDVWANTARLIIMSNHAITMQEWDSQQAVLQTGEKVSTYIALLDDAQEYYSRHEYRRAIIDVAIACEVFMRMMVLQTLPSDLDSDMRTMIEEANINQYVQKFFPNLLTVEEQITFKKLAKDHLNSLFSARNKIMHMAQYDRATNENCIRFIAAAKTLFKMRESLT